MNRDKDAVGVTFYYPETVFHIGDLLISYALNTVIVDRDILGTGIDDFKTVQGQKRAEVFDDIEVDVLFVGAVYADTTAVETTVVDIP